MGQNAVVHAMLWHAALLLGSAMIFLRICDRRALTDALAARGMREISVVQGGCESFDPVPGDVGD